jgi:hypothetical protein
LDQTINQSGEPVSPFVDRSEEAEATAQYGGTKTALKALELGAYGLGGYKALQALGKAIKPSPQPMPLQPGQSANMPGPTRPVAPPSAPLEPGGQKLTDFTQQKGAYQKPSMMQRGADMAQKVREVAAQKATSMAPLVRGATALGAAVMPGNVGQNYPFPQKGPMAGMEINPNTGRPWTPQELQQYNQAY